MARLACLALLLALAGCESLAPEPGQPAQWKLNGRLAIIAGDQREAFGFDWVQFERDYTIDLYGPLGLGVGRVQRTAGTVTLKLPGEPDVSARNADDLLFQVTGLAIPVTPLRFWVRGDPAPGRFVRTDSGFRQDGWQVEYVRREDGLPTRMVVSRPEARMTLVVRRWEA